MSYTVDWIAKVITIPVGDLTLVSGTHYRLNMYDFLTECRRLEAEFTEGLWAPQIVAHENTKFGFAGADYAPFDDIINGYTVEFGAGPTRVDLVGSNNNLVDILIPTGVAVVPSNSAGLQLVSIGSGLSTEEHDQLMSMPDVAEIWSRAVENGISAEQLLRAFAGVLLGVLEGAGTGTEIFKSLDGLTDRVTAEVDENGNRTSVTIDVS